MGKAPMQCIESKYCNSRRRMKRLVHGMIWSSDSVSSVWRSEGLPNARATTRYLETKRAGTRMRWLASVLLLCTLTSCSRFDPKRIGPGGLPPSIEQLDYATVATRQDELVMKLKSMAGFAATDATLQPIDTRWFLVLKSGMGLVDGQCEEYLNALFRFNREQHAIQQGLTAIAATTAAMLGLAGASGTAVAATAAALGLGSILFEAATNTVLFQLEPSAVRNIVRESSDTYKAAVYQQAEVYQSRPDAILGLQGYLALCTPAAIEARVNKAAIERTFIRPKADEGNPSPSLEGVSRREAGLTQEMSQEIQRNQELLRNLEQRLQEFSPGQPPIAPKIPAPLPGARGPSASAVQVEQLRRIQRALCITPDGIFGDDTRAALIEYRAGMAGEVPTDTKRDTPLSAAERERLQNLKPCQVSGFRSAFEQALLLDSLQKQGLPADRIDGEATALLQQWVERLMGDKAPILKSSTLPLEVRDAIEAKRLELRITTGAKGSITAELWRRVALGK